MLADLRRSFCFDSVSGVVFICPDLKIYHRPVYRALYVSLHYLSTSGKQAIYLNLLFKSIKADVDNTDGIKAIICRFVQVLVSGGNGATEFIAGAQTSQHDLALLGLFGIQESEKDQVEQRKAGDWKGQPAASGFEGGGAKLMKGEMGDMEDRTRARSCTGKSRIFPSTKYVTMILLNELLISQPFSH
ncbi:hypothetical protein C8F01DRAFT_1353669 [Mycena amicta]|nr:hypothetical protein C8F01DRAFT_1353669 [Mycena amicta]